MMADIANPTIHPVIISNNAPVSFTVHKKTETKTIPMWQFSTFLLKDKEFDSYFKKGRVILYRNKCLNKYLTNTHLGNS